jgi:hypothetical protein
VTLVLWCDICGYDVTVDGEEHLCDPPSRTDRPCIPPPPPIDPVPVVIPDAITVRGVGMMRILVTSDEEKTRETVKPGASK